MVLVLAETQKGEFKKAAYELVTYGKKTAEAMGSDCAALVLGTANGPEQLGQYGASKVYHVADTALDEFDSQMYTAAVAEAAKQVGATVIVLGHTSTGKSLLGRLAVRLNAGSVPGVNAVPEFGETLKVKKPVFSGKAFATYEIKSDIKLLSLMGNSLQPEADGSEAEVTALEVDLPAPQVKVKEVKRMEGRTPLPEAELVVSAGRGMKGPENWSIIEDLAEKMNATTACSRPVADAEWRPHHEHVGQTGVAIRPNLYVAVGISGAIQHLAGVNSSKTIVVINKDPEAPFFKAADYGVVGDLFDVVPRLSKAVEEFKSKN
jgi:electron transfer flavoprotein alpha subunit